jgi:hypothetical protein
MDLLMKVSTNFIHVTNKLFTRGKQFFSKSDWMNSSSSIQGKNTEKSTPTRKRGRPRSSSVDQAMEISPEKQFSPGRPSKKQLDEETKKIYLRALHKTVLKSVSKILQAEQHQEIVEYYKRINKDFFNLQFGSSSLLTQLEKNVSSLYQSLPKTSPIKTTIINELFEGISVAEISSTLDIVPKRVYEARSIESKKLNYYLRGLEIPRERLGLSETCLINWFLLACIVPSGRNRRCFFGTPSAMFNEYYCWTIQNAFPSVSPTTFFRIRKRENIWILKGDTFVDRGPIRIAEIDRLLLEEQNMEDIQSLQNEKDSLVESEIFAKQRISDYCEAHTSLEFQNKTVILTMDFTGIHNSMADTFQDFVLTIATNHEVDLSSLFSDFIISPETPSSLKGIDINVERTKKKRRKKSEMVDVVRPPVSPNLRKDIKQHHKTKKLDELQQVPSKYKPFLNYLHFLVKRSKDNKIKQTLDYVQWVLDFLALTGFFDKFNYVKIWSDGCGKHFKTYDTHFYIAHLQSRVTCVITWDFLAPNRAHNRCDAAAAHLKQAFKKYIQNNYILSLTSHLAFASGNLKNTFLIEADISAFKIPEHCRPDIPFMRDAFSFSYGEPIKVDVQCKCKCNKKSTCSHSCCKGFEATKVDLIIQMRDGDTIFRKLMSTDFVIPNRGVDEVDELWGNLDRELILPEIRVSPQNQNEEYEYGSVTFDDDDEVDSDYED